MQVMGTDPTAQERDLRGSRPLMPEDPEKPGSSRTTTATIASSGSVQIDPDGCALLQVTAKEFGCFGMCTGRSTFLTVEETGCGEPREILGVGYAGGTADVVVDGMEIRAWVESTSSAGRYRVDRARIAWRPSEP